MFRLLLVLAFLLLHSSIASAALPAAGGSIQGEFSFALDSMAWSSRAGYDVLAIPDMVPSGASGHPQLPTSSHYFRLPEGYRVTELRVDSADRRVLPGSRRFLPVSLDRSGQGMPRESPAVYASAGEYPGSAVELVAVGSWRGERIAEVRYHPVGWIPSTGEVVAYTRVCFSLLLEPETGTGTLAAGDDGVIMKPLRGSAASSRLSTRLLAGHVENLPVSPDGDDESMSAGIAAYTPFRPSEYPSLDGSLVEYVIITTDALASSFQPWADWKTQKGVPAVVRTLSWINANYHGGADTPERIRMFIRDAYQKWGTQYVLLGGDTGQVPPRYCHTEYYLDPPGEDIPADAYYSCLDGTWDGDGDGIYGEGQLGPAPGDQVDLYPEVFVGRAPVSTVVEVNTFINKTKNYRLTPAGTNQATAAFMGEVLFPNPWSYPDTSTISLNGCTIAKDAIERIRAPWDTVLVCEWPIHDMTFNKVRDVLNAGYGVVSIITHGDAFKVSSGDDQFFRLTDFEALNNDNKFGVYFYSNCNTSQFDADCLNEAALFHPTGGCVASIGPSRLEFPGISRFYMEEFYRLVFQGPSDVLGELSEVHRLKYIAQAQSDNAYRWVHLCAVLLGDPELHMWRSVPEVMTLSHAGSMSIGDSLYTVTITRLGVPVPRATVALWNSATRDYARGLTNSAGQIVFHFRPSATGAVQLSASHPAFKTVTTTMSVVSGGAARIAVSDVRHDDDGAGFSSGNGDGIPDAGERIELGVQLRNVGSSAVTSINAALTLANGAAITLDLLQNGIARPERVFLGQAGTTPGALPVNLPLGGGAPSSWGRPYFTTAAEADTGAYFWRDIAGCHLRFAGGGRTMTFSGSIGTDGSVLTSRSYGLEASDTLTPSATSVSFSVALDSTDVEDGIDLVVADSSHISILLGAASYGTLAPGDTLTQFFLLQTEEEARDRHSGRFLLQVTGTAGGAVAWSEGVRLELHAPVLAEEFHALNDSTDGGNKDGVIQIGETVRLSSLVRNLGAGKAIGIQGTLRAVSGITVLDSLVTFGDIAPGALVTGGTTFRLLATGATKVATLELRDSYGRVWSETMNLQVPEAPGFPVSRVVIPQVAGAIDLRWIPSVAADVLGYNVYRAPFGSTTYARVNEGVVEESAFYHDVAVTPELVYAYRVAAVDSAGNEGPRSIVLNATAPPPYLGTFPRVLKGEIWSSPLCMDLGEDASGDLEVIVGGKDGFLYVYNADGSPRAGWPKFLGDEVWSSPAVGNLDGDPQLEIIVGCNNFKLYAFNLNATGLISPDGSFATLQNQIRSTPVLADLDQNGTLEVIVGDFSGKLYAFRGNGTPYLATPIFATPASLIAAPPAVADLDSNGDLEVLVGNLAGRVYVYNHDGTPYLPPTGLFAQATGALWAGLAIGDADGNGQMDVFGATWEGYVYRWNHLGVVQSGWPKFVGDPDSVIVENVWATPALGDLNGDGKLECVIGTAEWLMHAYQWNGTELSGWPQSVGDQIWSPAALADITGDSRPDVIFTSMDRHIHALRHDGTRVPGWPLLFTDRAYASGPTVADIDRDGGVDVVGTSYEGRIYAWDIGKPWNPSPSASPWPTFGHDSYRTGWFNRPFTGIEGGPATLTTPLRTALAQNAPNPFNPRTVIKYDLSVQGNVELSVFDVAGRRVKQLVTGEQPAGRYRVIWDGTDDRGHDAASGVYFYRLETRGGTFDRKMILVR